MTEVTDAQISSQSTVYTQPPKLHFNTFFVVLVPAPEDVEVADFFFLVFFLTVEADECVF